MPQVGRPRSKSCPRQETAECQSQDVGLAAEDSDQRPTATRLSARHAWQRRNTHMKSRIAMHVWKGIA
ncbi:hypothetical protein N9L68_02160 [bacterium]|nr:hypothetical protein [bacterium]